MSYREISCDFVKDLCNKKIIELNKFYDEEKTRLKEEYTEKHESSGIKLFGKVWFEQSREQLEKEYDNSIDKVINDYRLEDIKEQIYKCKKLKYLASIDDPMVLSFGYIPTGFKPCVKDTIFISQNDYELIRE